MNLTDPATFLAVARAMRDAIHADPLATDLEKLEADACLTAIEAQA